MSLRDQMAAQSCVLLSTEYLGEKATWTPYGQTSGLQRTVRLIEQPDLQTIRRAHVWTARDGTTTSQGDLFRIKRGSDTMTWRVLYTDPAETALQRSHCHLQLTDTLKAIRNTRSRRVSGSNEAIPEGSTTSYRCKWFQSSAEITSDNRRRTLAGEWYCLLEVAPPLDTDIILTDSSDRAFRVERLEQGFNRDELPYLVCVRSDA